jgi:hypothetical protein
MRGGRLTGFTVKVISFQLVVLLKLFSLGGRMSD